MKAGNLRQRANGKWQYRADYGSHPDGRRRSRSATFPADSLKAAEKHARALRAQWDAEHAQQADYRGTMNELLDVWEANAKHSPTTAYRNRPILAAVRATFGPVKLVNITPLAIARWKLDLAKPYTRGKRTVTRGDTTIRQYEAWLSAILADGYRYDMIPVNPADKVKRTRTSTNDQAEHMPTLAALEVMLNACTNPNVRMGIQLAVATGCRAGEIAALRWGDLRDGNLFVAESSYKLPGSEWARKGTKANRPKQIPLPVPLLEALHAHRVWQVASCAKAGENALHGPILANLRDDLTASKPYPPSWLGKEWRDLCVRLELPAYKFHGLRHLHGSILTDAGVSLAAVANRQGHSVKVAADRYIHAVGDADREAANVIGAELSPLFQLTQGENPHGL